MKAACISALNEARTIGPLVRELYDRGIHRVYVIDNGGDGTYEAAKKHGAFIARSGERPAGIRSSMLYAWRWALEDGATQVVQLDAGGSHRPADACYALSMLDNDIAMAVGSRFHPLGRYYGRPWRARLSRAVTEYLNAFYQVSFTDWTSGLRAYRADMVDWLLRGDYKANMHAWQIETLAWACKYAVSIIDVPITYRAGRSSMNWSNALEAAQTLLRLRYA